MIREKLKVGIAGYGIVGKRRRSVVDSHPNLELLAVCDKIFTASGVLDNNVRCYPDYHYLVDEPLDILFVCLTNDMAAEVTIAGLEKGMHVFCEKPPGRTVEDIERVIAVERNNPGVKLKYGFNHRYHDSVREALRIVNSGELGKIVNMRGMYGKSKIIPFSGGWRAERKYAGGGILLDQGIHMVDLICLFSGRITDIKSYVSNTYWNHDVEDNVYALLKDEFGRVAMLHSSATQWQHRFSLDIALTEGYIELRGILSGSKSYGKETLVIGGRDEADTGTARHETINYLEDNSWRDEVFEFADSIVNGREIKYGTSGEALKVMKVIYGIYYADPAWRDVYNIPNPYVLRNECLT